MVTARTIDSLKHHKKLILHNVYCISSKTPIKFIASKGLDVNFRVMCDGKNVSPLHLEMKKVLISRIE